MNPIASRLPLAAVGLAGLLLLTPPFLNLAQHQWQQAEYGYAPFLALVSLFLFWLRGRDLRWTPDAGFPWLGVGLLSLGAVGYAIGHSQHIELIEMGCIIPLLAGALAISGGRAALYQLRFPLFFLIFLLPYPGWIIDSLTTPLKEWISQGAEWLLHGAGYPVARDGVVLGLGPYMLLVADACSGLHSLIFLLALGLLYLDLTGPRGRWINALLISSLLPIAVFANLVRVLILLLITYHFGDGVGQSYWHGIAGVVVFVAAFAALFALDAFLALWGKRPAVPHPSALRKEEAGPALGWPRSLSLAAVLLFTAAAGQILMPSELRAKHRPAPQLETLIPAQFGGWERADLGNVAIVSPDLKAGVNRLYAQTLSRSYRDRDGRRIMLSIAYGSHQQGNELQAHRPEFCYKAQGFTLLGTSETELPVAGQRLPVRHIVARQRSRIEPITYWMTVGDNPALPGLQRKLAQIRYGLSGEIPDGMLVRVSSVGRDAAQEYALQARFIAALREAVPGQLGFTGR
jgi:EpsI family protein